jgi:UPF0176 protein
MGTTKGSIPMAEAIWNGAFYRFSEILDPTSLKNELLQILGSLNVRGTILVAEEGFNGSIAAPESHYKEAWAQLRKLPLFRELLVKESQSAGEIPFDRLVVKVKSEIVTFRQGESWGPCSVSSPRAPHLPAEELKLWLDEGRDFVLLDTRNAFEFRLGSFERAVHLDIPKFVDLPSASKHLKEIAQGRPIVSFCTGGIRCEKAAPYLAAQGDFLVHQLEGGILEYFAKIGGHHWRGECFVFDNRIALSPQLQSTGARLCTFCQEPVPKGQTCAFHPEFLA